MSAAYNLIHGKGLTTAFDLSESTLSPRQVAAFHGAVPLVHFPPLYPVVLAALSTFGTSIAESARWLNAVLFGANLLIFELLLRRFSRSSILVPLAGALLLLLGPAVLYHVDYLWFHSSVLSEPLFLLVFLTGVLLIDKFLDRADRAVFVGIAACVAVAPLIRYVGLSMVVAAAIVIVLWAPLAPSRRRLAAATIVGCGLLPSIAWSLVASAFMHGGSARDFAWHPEAHAVRLLLYFASAWILPASIPDFTREALFVVVLGGVVVLLVVQVRRPRRGGRDISHIWALVIFAASYLALVVFTRTFLDAILSFDTRVLAPLIPLLYLIIVGAIMEATPRRANGVAIVIGLFLLAAISSIGPTVSFVAHGPPSGKELADSATMRAVRALPAGTLIASGIPDLIYTDTGRPSIRVPVRVDALTERTNGRFWRDAHQLSGMLTAHNGVLVEMPAARSDFVPTGAKAPDLRTIAPLRLVRTFPDGGKMYRTGAGA